MYVAWLEHSAWLVAEADLQNDEVRPSNGKRWWGGDNGYDIGSQALGSSGVPAPS